MKKIWQYLLLNVVVSAATVLIVLLLWNAAHPQQSSAAGNTSGSTNGSVFALTPTATLPPLSAKLFEIQQVIGLGDLENEYLHVLYLGSEPLNLQNWSLQTGRKTIYTFPAFILFKGGAVNLYTKAGSDSSIELYMGLSKSVWASGGEVILSDPQGNVRLTYKIH
jgi:hypothetical protein